MLQEISKGGLMMKKRILVMAAALALAGCSMTQAALTDKVAGMIRAEKYMMTFTQMYREVHGDETGMMSADDFSKPYVQEVSLASSGAKKLLVIGGHKKDGSYFMTTRYRMIAGPEEVYAEQKPSKDGESYVDENLNITPALTKLGKSNEPKDFTYFSQPITDGLLQEFLPILPEKNRISDVDGSITHINHCVTYNGSGTQQIGTTSYQYEEFVSPADHFRKEVTRYYFDGKGQLVAIIHMKAPYEEVYMDGTRNFPGSYTVYQFSLFSDAVPDSIFKIPATVEIKEDKD